uniref:Uncharacterized protein n=1 Tax=Pygocentrus nattereri TaxID=42514 RepID=A0AAR2LPH0_PYGNA
MGSVASSLSKDSLISRCMTSLTQKLTQWFLKKLQKCHLEASGSLCAMKNLVIIQTLNRSFCFSKKVWKNQNSDRCHQKTDDQHPYC